MKFLSEKEKLEKILDDINVLQRASTNCENRLHQLINTDETVDFDEESEVFNAAEHEEAKLLKAQISTLDQERRRLTNHLGKIANHVLWHMFVLAGAIAHFFMIF